MSKNTNRDKAFSLAEVLITLGIIGVVAAITLPTIISNYQKTQYVTGLKKAYTEFNQVLMEITSDYNCIGDLKCTGLFASDTTYATLGDELVKHFKVIKNCGNEQGQHCCALTNFNYDGLSLSTRDYDNEVYYKFITIDGISIWVEPLFNNCEANWSTGELGNMSMTCGNIVIDVNGPTKGPNYRGRDVFQFWITNGKGPVLYPRGGIDDNQLGSNYWWKDPMTNQPRYCHTGNKSGIACTARIIEESWEMNY